MVPLLDLKGQYNTIRDEIDTAVQQVIESQMFILGSEVEKMESELCDYLGCKYSLGVSSGTDALLLSLMAIGIKPGAEVIVPTYSFFATAGAVARLNAIPVFVDIDKKTFNLDPNKVEAAITAHTKAIIPVHLYGQSADMEPLVKISKKYNLYIIEDCAQAIGARYKDNLCVGNHGHIGCFSFFPSKNLGCFGDAGLVITNDKELYEKLKILRVHGGEQKYYHKIIGGNFRIDALQAAVIRVKLPYLDSWSTARRNNAELYTRLFIEAGLADIAGRTQFDGNNKVLLPEALYKNSIPAVKNYHIYNQFVIRVEKRNALKAFLNENGIGCEIYYPVPFHRQECFAYLNNKDEDFPVSNCGCNDSLALPIYPELTSDQIEYVVSKINEFIRNSEDLPFECKHCECMNA